MKIVLTYVDKLKKYVILVLFLSFLAGLYLLFKPLSGSMDLTNQLKSSENFNSSQILSKPDYPQPLCSVISRNKTLTFDIDLTDKHTFKSMSVYFPGDTTQGSYAPSNFTVYYYDENNNKVFLKEISKNENPYYLYASKQGITASKIEFVVSEPLYWVKNADHATICLANLQLYQTFVHRYQLTYSALHYWFLYLFLGLFLLLPGKIILNIINYRWHLIADEDLELIISPIIGIVLICINVLIYLLLDHRIILWFYPVIFLLSIFSLLDKRINKLKLTKTTLIVFVALIGIFLVSSRKEMTTNLYYVDKVLDSYQEKSIPIGSYFGYFEDNMYPWRIARFYLHRYSINSDRGKVLLTDTSIFDRTPIFPLTAVSILNIFGEGHFYFERFLEMLVAISVGSIYVMIKQLTSNKNIALITTLLLLLNTQRTLISFNAEVYYKYFAIYPLFLASILLFKDHLKYKEYMMGLLMACAFLIHPFTLLVSMSIVTIYIIKHRLDKILIPNCAKLGIFLLLSTAFWFLLPKVLSVTGHYQLKNSRYLSDVSVFGQNLIRDKVESLVVLFVPNYKLKGENNEPIAQNSDAYLNQLLRFSLIANLTPLLALYTVYKLTLKKSKGKSHFWLGFLALIYFWFFYLHKYDSWHSTGGTYYLLFPYSVPLILTFAVQQILKEKLWLRIILILSYLAFMLINAIYLADILNNFGQPANTSWLFFNQLFTIIYFVIISGLLLFNIIKNPHDKK